MLYTGFREIDDTLGGIENGELVVIASDTLGEYFQHLILYNLAKQTDTLNRQNIKNYDKKIKAISNYNHVKLEKPIEKVIVLGRHDLEYNALSGFPRGEYDAKQFDLFTQRRLLFKDLPIEQSFAYLYQRSANALIKDITHTYEDIKTQISALCVFGNRRKIPLLKEVAQKLNISVVMFIYGDIDFASHRLKSYIQKIDKFIVLEDNYYKREYADTPYENTMTLYIKNIITGFEEKINLHYRYKLYLESDYNDAKYRLKQKDCTDILQRMASNDDFINKYNFSKYMHLSREKNKKFWAYIEVFQRIELENLCELITEYKPNIDKQELMLAVVILRKLLTRDDDNAEKITIYPKPNE